jgi:hypothetical protein
VFTFCVGAAYFFNGSTRWPLKSVVLQLLKTRIHFFVMKTFFNSFAGNPKNDILSGITVALALVPEAVAFAFVAGIDPLVGLYGAFMMGLITSLFGGRPGMISGATGAMAVVMVHLIQQGNRLQIWGSTGSLSHSFSWVEFKFSPDYSNLENSSA